MFTKRTWNIIYIISVIIGSVSGVFGFVLLSPIHIMIFIIIIALVLINKKVDEMLNIK
jgi:hypothetical protein